MNENNDDHDHDVHDNRNDTAPSTKVAVAAATTAVTRNQSDLYETPLEVIYQDACMAVINKPQGMTVMGGRPSLIRCHLLMSLVCTPTEKEHALATQCDKALGKPRPVHRLDNATGGLLVLAKTYLADRTLHAAFMNRLCHKRYRALLIGRLELTCTTLPPHTTLFSNDICEHGSSKDAADNGDPKQTDNRHDHAPPNDHPPPDAVILADVDGKVSKTCIRVVRYIDANHLLKDDDDIHNNVTSNAQSFSSSNVTQVPKENEIAATTPPRWYTMVDLWPVTGRRHQLRKHMKLIGYSIYGDTRYIAASILAERYHPPVPVPSKLPRLDPQVPQQHDSPSPPQPPPLCLWAMEITIPHPYTGIEMTFTVPNHDDPNWFHPTLLLLQHKD